MSKEKTLKSLILLILLALLFSLNSFSQSHELGADFLFNEGMSNYKNGLDRVATEYFRRCLELDPTHKGAKKYLGFTGQTYISQEIKEALMENESMLKAHSSRPAVMPKDPYVNLDYRTASGKRVRRLSPKAQFTKDVRDDARQDFADKNQIREETIAQARKDYELEKVKVAERKEKREAKKRDKLIDKTLDDATFEMSFSYHFVRGEQSFKVITTGGDQLSKLTYPISGGVGYINTQVKLSPKLFFGGRYGASNLRKTTSKDEDWDVGAITYQITEQDTKSRSEYFDANIYYRGFDWHEPEMGDDLAGFFMVDRLYIDFFGGYQHYKARHTMVDPTTLFQFTTGGTVFAVATPLNSGLNSHYEVINKGPRAGVRIGGSFGEKISSNLNLSYAWIKTKAHGNWNLRNYDFWQEGDSGYGFTLDAEAKYHFTPNLFVGGGFHYMEMQQQDLLETGVQPGSAYTDLNIIRDVDTAVYGPSLQLGYRW